MKTRARKRIVSPPKDKGLTEQKVVAARPGTNRRSRVVEIQPARCRARLGCVSHRRLLVVKGRDELLGRVVAYAHARCDAAGRRRGLEGMLTGNVQSLSPGRYSSTPNIAPLIGTQLRPTEGIRADLIERVLSLLVAAGFSDELLVDAYNVVIGALVGFISQELAAMPSESPGKWAEIHRKRVSTLDVIEHPTLARYLPKLANKAFIVRWSNGVEVPLDSSFDMFVDVIILGLEQKLNPRRR